MKHKNHSIATIERVLSLNENEKKIIGSNNKSIVSAIQVLEQIRNYINDLNHNNIDHESFFDIVVGLVSCLARSEVNSNYYLQSIKQDYRKIGKVLNMPIDVEIYEHLKSHSCEELKTEDIENDIGEATKVEFTSNQSLDEAEYLNATPKPKKSSFTAAAIIFFTNIKTALLYRIRLYTAPYVKPPRAARSLRKVLTSLQTSTPVQPDIILRPDLAEMAVQVEPYNGTGYESDILIATNALVMSPPSTRPESPRRSSRPGI